jgi:hypothetical protein
MYSYHKFEHSAIFVSFQDRGGNRVILDRNQISYVGPAATDRSQSQVIFNSGYEVVINTFADTLIKALFPDDFDEEDEDGA